LRNIWTSSMALSSNGSICPNLLSTKTRDGGFWRRSHTSLVAL
jgi:hypothetical protein